MQRLPTIDFLGLSRRKRDISGGEAVPELFHQLQTLGRAQPGDIDASSAHGANIDCRGSASNGGVGRLTDRA